jgi:hypothetical protein
MIEYAFKSVCKVEDFTDEGDQQPRKSAVSGRFAWN